MKIIGIMNELYNNNKLENKRFKTPDGTILNNTEALLDYVGVSNSEWYSLTDLIETLQSEVEIIEEVEDKDITEVLEIELLGQCDNWLQSKTVNKKIDMELNPYILEAITRNFKLLYSKQCEIVDVVNKLKNDNRKEVRLVEAKEYEDIEEIKLVDTQNLWDRDIVIGDKLNALIRNQKYILEQLNKEGK